MSDKLDLGSLDKLTNEELSSVCFVRDYVEFHFDGPILRAISKPDLKDAPKIIGDQGWRDRLCSLIGSKVVSVFLDGEIIGLRFSNKQILYIPALPQPPNDEALHFVPTGSGPMEIW